MLNSRDNHYTTEPATNDNPTLVVLSPISHTSDPQTNTASPVALRRQFNIPEKQYFQMCLLALCVDEDWPAIEDLVTTKGFMGIGKKKKSPIGFERIVKTIARKSLKPPIQVSGSTCCVKDTGDVIVLCHISHYYPVRVCMHEAS